MKFDILVRWLEYKRGNYRIKTRWVRSVTAASLSEAADRALSQYQDRIYPAMSMSWRVWP